MSDMLTHWAVFDDCRRLAQLQPDDNVHPLFRSLIESEREFGRLGAITRGGGRLMPPVMRQLRDEWPRQEKNRRMESKIGFVLGSLTHRACDKIMKPLLSELGGSDWDEAHHAAQTSDEGRHRPYTAPHLEISAYFDTYVFRKVYLDGAEEPFSKFLLAETGSAASSQALEEFVRSLFQRALLSIHTITPDLKDPAAWLDGLFDLVQPYYVDVECFANVFHSPDPEKMRQYRVETDFYRADDPAVQMARRLQNGVTVDRTEARAAVETGANKGHYGRALELGMRYIADASAFWRSESDDVVGKD